MLKNNINPSSTTYGIMIKAYGFLINACITNNNIPKVFELYEALKNESFEISTILYTTLIKAYAKQKDLGKVIEVFNTIQ